jgi:hypothetical protein
MVNDPTDRNNTARLAMLPDLKLETDFEAIARLRLLVPDMDANDAAFLAGLRNADPYPFDPRWEQENRPQTDKAK